MDSFPDMYTLNQMSLLCYMCIFSLCNKDLASFIILFLLFSFYSLMEVIFWIYKNCVYGDKYQKRNVLYPLITLEPFQLWELCEG